MSENMQTEEPVLQAPPAAPVPPAEGALAAAGSGAATATIKAAEKAASTVQKRATPAAQPVRQYLESTVVPLLMQGLQALCKERPEDPVEYLAHYLLQHNPQKAGAAAPTTADEGAAPAAPAAAAAPAPAQ